MKPSVKIIAVILLISFFGCTNKKGMLPLPQTSLNTTSVVSGCDSTIVSYQKNVIPILSNNCYSCHSTAVTTNLGGQDLENFTSLKNYLNYQFQANGIYGSKFMHIINQTSGVLPMPPTSKLSVCDIAIINKWIADGAPQN